MEAANSQQLNPEIEDVSFILNSLSNTITNMVQAMYHTFEKHGHPVVTANGPRTEDVMMEGASRYALILVCSFMDEWDGQIDALIGQGMERDRLVKVRRIAKPAIDEIRTFDGLRDYRSKLLAHNPRIGRDGNRNALRGNFVANLRVPVSLPDYRLLANCIHYCKRVFNKEFPEYDRLPSDFIAEHTDRNFPKGITTAYFEQRIDDVGKRIAELGRNY
jgi:hypothetical protein